MTISPQSASSAPSRRAMLAGALGALGALAASALGRPAQLRGANGGSVILGQSNTATLATIVTNNGTGSALYGVSQSYFGVEGASDQGVGVRGYSASTGIGVWGGSNATDLAATVGWSFNNSTGLFGYSNSGDASSPSVKPKTGVYGYAAQDSSARGVIGESTTGHGIHGVATSGFAGYFEGKVFTTKYYELTEIVSPAAPSLNRARLFIRDDGAGKTQLCVRFNSGGVLVLATQP